MDQNISILDDDIPIVKSLIEINDDDEYETETYITRIEHNLFKKTLLDANELNTKLIISLEDRVKELEINNLSLITKNKNKIIADFIGIKKSLMSLNKRMITVLEWAAQFDIDTTKNVSNIRKDIITVNKELDILRTYDFATDIFVMPNKIE